MLIRPLVRSVRRLVSFLRNPDDTLAERVLHSGFWATLLNVFDRGLQLTKTAVLARLLLPADFGVYGIAILSIGALRRFSKVGFDSALIQHEKENIDEYLDTAWVVKLVRGIVLFAILFVSAPAVARTFDQPRVELVVRAVGIVALLDGAANPAIVYFRKELEFHKQFAYQISGTLIATGVAIGTGLLLENVWALVYGLIAGSATQLVVSHLIADHRPSFTFARKYARELFGFGKWILLLEIVVWLATEGDDAFVGWYLSAGALGLYQLAFRFSNAPATEVTHVISAVTFPAYAKLQDDGERLRRAFSKTIEVTFLLAIPVSVGTFLISPAFTRVILGEKWLPMLPALQVMIFAGFARAVAATGGALFQGVGMPKWDFRMNLVRTIVIALTIWPLTDALGITGAAVSISLGIGCTLPIWLYKTHEITDLALTSYAERIGLPLIGAVCMIVPVRMVVGPTFLQLVSSIFCGMVVYCLSVVGLYRWRGDSVRSLLSVDP